MKVVSIQSFLQRLTHFLPLLLFGLALLVVHKEMGTRNFSQIVYAVKEVPIGILALAIVLTLINYLVLGGYDYLALRYTGHRQVPVAKILIASLISYPISNNTGHAWAAGGSVRYRFYSAWGIPGWDVLKISFFLSITYFLGVLALGLGSSLLLPVYIHEPIKHIHIIRLLSVICALSLAIYWLAVIFWKKPLTVKGFEFRLPSAGITLGQTLIAAFDVVLSSVVLWVILFGHVQIDFMTFLLIFVIAQAAGVISQVPGGIGVFESAFVWFMSDIHQSGHHLWLIGALFLFRIIYYFIPLTLAGIGLLGFEVFTRRKAFKEGGRVFGRMLSIVIPQIYSVLLLFSGGILLISGALPTGTSSMEWLQDFIPLPVFEISHLIGSISGLALLFLARGIRLRIDAAWYGSLFLLATGSVTSLLKGLDWQDSLALMVMFLLLLPTRKYFRRKSSLVDMPFSRPWIVMITIVLIGVSWLGFFAYHNVQYAGDLWWQFSYKGDAPRFLRALLITAVLATGYALYYLLAVAHPRTLRKPDQEELDEAAALIATTTDSRGFLALLGDKYLSWSEDRKAFLMFDITRRYWIVMGDPVGEPKSAEALLWRFREQVDLYNAKVVFYQVSDNYLPYYLDLGLSLLKIGEEARVDLSSFSLQGKRFGSQRTARNKFVKNGYRFAMLTKEELLDNLETLRSISDRWLAQKKAHEKSFSLGFFSEDYIKYTDVAAVYDQTGKIVAFANIWKTAGLNELSVDLMRYDPESPNGIMEYLFVELMLWSKDLNFKKFSLGMAPLAGLERHPLAPLWHKIGTVIFDLGEEFYNFEGLYAYKAKFAPEWLPRYLAAPAGLLVPFILMTITRRISGGWKAIFAK